MNGVPHDPIIFAGAHIPTFLLVLRSGRVPVTAAVSILTMLTTLPGLSQYSAFSGVTLRTRMLGSSADFHHACAVGSHNSLIFSWSFETVARPDSETNLKLLVSACAIITCGYCAISSSL